MHASWLKHLNFPLVPYHTVLQSACSSNRLIGPIIPTNFDLTNRHKTVRTYLIVGRIKCLPSLHTFHTLAYFLTSGVEMSRDTNTSESKGWNGISHLDLGCLIIEHMIKKNKPTGRGICRKLHFYYHFTCNGTDHCIHLKLGGSYHVMKNRGIQFILCSQTEGHCAVFFLSFFFF